jgi:hypothetical protein
MLLLLEGRQESVNRDGFHLELVEFSDFVGFALTGASRQSTVPLFVARFLV